VLALGLTGVMYGLVLGLIPLAIGFVIFIVGLAGWINQPAG